MARSNLQKCMLVLSGFGTVLIVVFLLLTRTTTIKAPFFKQTGDTTGYYAAVHHQNRHHDLLTLCSIQDYTSRMDVNSFPDSDSKFNFLVKRKKIHRQRYLVIGAISYPGYIVSKVLKANKVDYRITEDISSLGFDLGTWNNHDKLVEIGITPSILDYSDDKVVKSQVDWLGNDGTLIYVPSLLFNANTSPFDVEYTSSIMNNFIMILERLKMKKKGRTKVLCLKPSTEGAFPQATAVWQFSLILSSYAHFYSNIQSNFISFDISNYTSNLIQNPLRLHHCDETLFESIQLAIIGESAQCMHWCNCKHSRETETAGEQLKKRNFVTTTYFTRGSSTVKKDSFQFIKGFFMTAVKQKLGVLIFYDELGSSFLHQVKELYDKVEFVKREDMHGRQKNDARFYILYEYLLEHPEVGSIVLQDLRDGIFTGDPFKVMSIIGDLIYVGLDKGFDISAFDNSWLGTGHKYKSCLHGEANKDEIRYHPFYNAGTIGGTRDVMLTFLNRLLRYLDKTPPESYGCDMPAVCAVTHNHFYDHSFSGYPFQIYFASSLGPPPGLAVRHKDTQYV